MSSCQNKLITITGAKAGIQKFISSTICIVSLSSATQCVWVCVCVCVCSRSPVMCVLGTTRCRHSNPLLPAPLSWFLFPLCGWIKMFPLALLKVWAPAQFMFKELKSEKQRLTITATKAWPTGREALIELKLSLWIDHCVNFRINRVLSLQGALQLRRGEIWNLSHGLSLLFHSSFCGAVTFCPVLICDNTMICTSHKVQYQRFSWESSAVRCTLCYTEQQFGFRTLSIKARVVENAALDDEWAGISHRWLKVS